MSDIIIITEAAENYADSWFTWDIPEWADIGKNALISTRKKTAIMPLTTAIRPKPTGNEVSKKSFVHLFKGGLRSNPLCFARFCYFWRDKSKPAWRRQRLVAPQCEALASVRGRFAFLRPTLRPWYCAAGLASKRVKNVIYLLFIISLYTLISNSCYYD